MIKYFSNSLQHINQLTYFTFLDEFIWHHKIKEHSASLIILLTRNTFCGTWYLLHSRDHKSIAELCSNFRDSAINTGQIAYLSLIHI